MCKIFQLAADCLRLLLDCSVTMENNIAVRTQKEDCMEKLLIMLMGLTAVALLRASEIMRFIYHAIVIFQKIVPV